MNYIGQRVKIADPDGSVYDAKLVRLIGDHLYVYDLNGCEGTILRREVERQLAMRLLKRLALIAGVMLAAYLLWLVTR